MKVSPIENSGPNTVVQFLRNAGSRSKQIDIGVAFITAAGLNSLLYLLKKTATIGSVRILTGLYQGFTEPKALRTLLRVQEETEGRLTVKLSRDPHFHWKSYYLINGTKAHVVVGSSNLTEDGLSDSGELNIVLSLATSSKPFCDLRKLFDEHWESRAEQISDDLLSRYEEQRTEAGAGHRKSISISSIFGRKHKPKPEVKLRAPRYWRTCVNGYLSEETVSLLSETTNWDRKGWLYLSAWNTSFFRGDLVLVFDINGTSKGTSLYVAEIVDTTTTPVRTPDGTHFAAFKRLKKYDLRKLVPNRWKMLKADGLLKRKDDADYTKRISIATFERFVENLKRPS